MFSSAFADPFFSDVNTEVRKMNQDFDRMVGRFSGNNSLHPALEHDSRKRSRRERAVGERDCSVPSNAVQPFGNWMADPFSMMNNMMSSMRHSMSALQQQTADPNSGVYSFSSSSFYSSSSNGRDGEPRVIEAHTAERRAPGGVRESRRAYRDSESGVAKMAIGHHLGDRAHIIERSENRRTDQREQRDEYHGFDETEAARFNEEWQQRARGAMAGSQGRQLGLNGSRNGSAAQQAIEHPSSSDRNDRKRK